MIAEWDALLLEGLRSLTGANDFLQQKQVDFAHPFGNQLDRTRTLNPSLRLTATSSSKISP
jgi:hypothetical protein